MITPFNENFQLEDHEITLALIQRGYVIIQKNPELSTVEVYLDQGNSILSSEYIVEEVVEENIYLYPDATIGDYVLTWGVNDSSSSSSSASQLKLRELLESGNYSIFQIRYISTL